jgi:hypothetical protein
MINVLNNCLLFTVFGFPAAAIGLYFALAPSAKNSTNMLSKDCTLITNRQGIINYKNDLLNYQINS